MKKLFFGWILLTVLLLAGVAVAPLIAIARRWMLNDGAGSGSYQKNEVIFGVIGEGIRGLILLYLYPQMKGAGSALRHAIWFGLMTSALIGSIWLLVGVSSFPLANPVKFLVNDTLILFAQGLLSGGGLYIIYRSDEKRYADSSIR
ncbi:MAG TPA: hypothetical protein VJ810_10070 [Blastocatellia bacterium]|nr:hypothetical protein [Blastocatellia bacterium]